jgi:hypothetical protein
MATYNCAKPSPPPDDAEARAGRSSIALSSSKRFGARREPSVPLLLIVRAQLLLSKCPLFRSFELRRAAAGWSKGNGRYYTRM